MRTTKKLLISLSCIVLCIAQLCHAQDQQKPPVIFELSSLIKQDTNARKKILIKKLEEEYHRKISTLGLWHIIRTVFDLPFLGNERQVHVEYFKFLAEINLPEHYPTITFEGNPLPPVMTAWNLGKLSAQQVIDLAQKHIDAQNCSDANKIFYRALVYTSFDPEVTKNTKVINKKAEKLVDICRTQERPVYLVGHCDASARAWLQETQAPLLAKFNKVLFSCQVRQLPPKFSDAWWLEQLGLTKNHNSHDYIYICDWTPDGAKGDAPPHYSCTSKALKTLLT